MRDTRATQLPTFLVIGAMKAGTTTLYEQLGAHPEIAMSEVKELDFWVDELNYRKGLDWYQRQFPQVRRARAMGEASTSYTKYPNYCGVPSRIAAAAPRTKFIYLVRHPVDRIESQFRHESLLGFETRPFADAVLHDTRYVDVSRYAMQVEQFLDFFPREQVLIVLLEDLRQRRRDTLESIFRFLGVDPAPSWAAQLVEANASEGKRVPLPRVRRLVQSSAYRRVSPYVPAATKRIARRTMLHGPRGPAAFLTADVRDELVSRLADDVATLRSYLTHDFDGWGIA